MGNKLSHSSTSSKFLRSQARQAHRPKSVETEPKAVRFAAGCAFLEIQAAWGCRGSRYHRVFEKSDKARTSLTGGTGYPRQPELLPGNALFFFVLRRQSGNVGNLMFSEQSNSLLIDRSAGLSHGTNVNKKSITLAESVHTFSFDTGHGSLP